MLYIYETSDIVREMKKANALLMQLNDELTKYNDVLPHMTADTRSHKDIRSYEDIVLLFYKKQQILSPALQGIFHEFLMLFLFYITQ